MGSLVKVWSFRQSKENGYPSCLDIVFSFFSKCLIAINVEIVNDPETSSMPVQSTAPPEGKFKKNTLLFSAKCESNVHCLRQVTITSLHNMWKIKLVIEEDSKIKKKV